MVRAQDDRRYVDDRAAANAAPPAVVSITPGGWRSIFRSPRRARLAFERFEAGAPVSRMALVAGMLARATIFV